MKKVLFVCLGNICRSPMAEALMRDLVEKEGLSEQISIDSAGTGSWHIGNPPHEGTLKILNKKNIRTDGMTARQFTKEDFSEFDYIVAMDESNIENMYKMTELQDQPHVFRLLDLTDDRKDVPDPYFTGDFQETYDLVTKGCQALLEKIQKDL